MNILTKFHVVKTRTISAAVSDRSDINYAINGNN